MTLLYSEDKISFPIQNGCRPLKYDNRFIVSKDRGILEIKIAADLDLGKIIGP